MNTIVLEPFVIELKNDFTALVHPARQQNNAPPTFTNYAHQSEGSLYCQYHKSELGAPREPKPMDLSLRSQSCTKSTHSSLKMSSFNGNGNPVISATKHNEKQEHSSAAIATPALSQPSCSSSLIFPTASINQKSPCESNTPKTVATCGGQKKDAAYLEHRRKNNAAAKMSRCKRRNAMDELAAHVKETETIVLQKSWRKKGLAKRNDELKVEVAVFEAELLRYKGLNM